MQIKEFEQQENVIAKNLKKKQMILVLENSLNIKHRQCFYKEIKQKSKLLK